MRRSFLPEDAQTIYLDVEAENCRSCGNYLYVPEHRDRYVQRRDGLYHVVRRLKWCQNPECPAYHVMQLPLVDLRLALPKANYGTDLVVEIGERHMAKSESLGQIQRDLNEHDVPVCQRYTCTMFRKYVALTMAARGNDHALRERLIAQGGMVLMFDGVQFDATSPVLYMAWEAISGEVLFGERQSFRGKDDIVPFLERVKAMNVPIIGVVSDKERGLLPAVAEVFPGIPHQLCQLHFLKNCALGMASDLRALQASVEERAERVQAIAKRLHKAGCDSSEVEGGHTLGNGTGVATTLSAGAPAPVRHPSRVKSASGAAAGDHLPQAAPDGPTLGSDVPKGVAGAHPEDGIAPPATLPRVEEQRPAVKRCSPAVPLTEEQLAAELCAMARHASRATGRAPLAPPELVRHQRLEEVSAAVAEAVEKRGPSRSSRNSKKRSSRAGTAPVRRGG
jgi:hypothetical protein